MRLSAFPLLVIVAAANEDKLRAVEKEFSYRQQIETQTMGEGGSLRGQLHRVNYKQVQYKE